MAFSSEDMAVKFLRTYGGIFTAKEMKKVLNASGIPASVKDAKEFLESSPIVLELADGKFITHAGAFTGEIFSIVPSDAEAEQLVLVPGDRCMPFIETDRLPSTISFYINGQKLPQKIGEFDSDLAIDMYVFHGEEYAPQLIASDPANSDIDFIGREFELPNTVRLTGFDMTVLAKKYNYRKGDRLLCCVADWDAGRINIMVVHSDSKSFDKGEIGEKRIEWFYKLEQIFLDSFRTKGPLGTIEEQLINVFFENRKTLCVPYCGSVEEFLFKHSKKVAFEHYGVETRLWYKGQEVPAFGEWNEPVYEETDRFREKCPFPEYVLASIPDPVYDQIVLDGYYSKTSSLVADAVSLITQDEFDFSDSDVGFLALKLEERNAILESDYNWFADQEIGKVRHKILELYGKVAGLVHKIDYLGRAVFDFPSQEVVILAQLHSHILRMMETISVDPEIESNSDAVLLSLDGMDWNFGEILPVLKDAIAGHELSRFKVVK